MFEKMIDRYTALTKKGKIFLWVAVVIVVIIAIPSGGTDETEVSAPEVTTTVAPTTTEAPTTAVDPTTTTRAPTTTRPATTTTEADLFSSREAWNLAAVAVLSDDDGFDGWSAADILEQLGNLCRSIGDGGDGVAYVITVAGSGDPEFALQVAAMIGVLAVGMGCESDSDQVHIDDAFEFLSSL